MNKITKLSIAALGLGMVLALTPALRAQEAGVPNATQAPPAQDQRGMMGTDMQGMMRMMAQMREMMDQCSRMMQSMTNPPSAPAPDHR